MTAKDRAKIYRKAIKHLRYNWDGERLYGGMCPAINAASNWQSEISDYPELALMKPRKKIPEKYFWMELTKEYLPIRQTILLLCEQIALNP